MMSVIYGYARVSSTGQNLDRQINELMLQGIEERFIFLDKQSGKDFDRRQYNSLVGTPDVAPRLQEGDLLVITSLDRLGRNYEETREQWEHITKNLKADIKVLDMPLLDTSNSRGDLDTRFIADLVLQILSYVAQKERESSKERQKQGIASAKARGKHLGRPKARYPDNWEEVHAAWKAGEITAVAAAERTGLPRSTFYKLSKQYVTVVVA